MKDQIVVPLSETFFDQSYNFDQKAEEVAKQRGQVVVFPESNQLQLDIDSEEAYQRFETLYIELGLGWRFSTTICVKSSKSGLPHRHITISLYENDEPYEMTESERIALQFALGSDPVREFLNLKRFVHGVENPTRLFEEVV